MKKINKNAGFSLAETLVAVAIFVVISGIVSFFYRDITLLFNFGQQDLNAQLGARKVLKPMVSEVRSASRSELGSYHIASSTDSFFAFYSDIDNDGLTEKLEYYLDNGTFKRDVISPSGDPLIYDEGNRETYILIENVVNTPLEPIFEYYGTDYDGTGEPLDPISIPDIRLVKIAVIMDEDPNRPPDEIVVTTQVSIRNLKDNL